MKYPLQFGKYLLLERVNVGGMAEVFKAKQFGVEGFQRIIAVKRILPNMSEDTEFINMFVDEARLAVQLNHANIVQIYELDKVMSQYYIAMEYVAGKDLRRIIEGFRKRKQVMPVPLAAYICARVCDGLDYAHRKIDASGKPMRLVHRDVSPQNILVSFDGDVKVIDFGIAKAADRLSKTQAGVLKGKFGYMSPEQVSGSEIDHRSDLFAVGVLLWEMLTCQRLFVAETDFSTLEKVRQCDIPPMNTYNAEIPPELELVVRKALAKDLSERFEWCSDFSEALNTFMLTDHSIFNSKRMQQFMRETFREDIELESSKQQEFARITLEDVAAGHSTGREDSVQQVSASDRTAIFEEGNADLASQPTRVGDLDSIRGNTNSKRQPQQVDPELRATRDLSDVADEVRQGTRRSQEMGNERSNAGRSGPLVNPTMRVPEIPEERDNTKFILGGAVLAALLIVGGAVWWTQRARGPSGGSGTEQTVESTLVRVQVTPPIVTGELFVDKKSVQRGTTPFDPMKLPVGKHEVRFVAKDYEDWVRNIELKPDTTNIMKVELTARSAPVPSAPVPSAPSAPAPSAPLASGPVASGPIVSGPVTPPQPSGASAKVEVKKVSIEVDSDPSGATLYVDGKKIGTTPKKFEAELGRKLNVELKRAGYKTFTDEVVVSGNDKVSPKLVKDTGSNGGGNSGGNSGGNGGGNSGGAARPPAGKDFGFLVVNTPQTPDTKIIVDGRDTKRVTPIFPNDPLKLAPGMHAVTLIFSDGTKRSFQISIEKNQTYKLIEKK